MRGHALADTERRGIQNAKKDPYLPVLDLPLLFCFTLLVVLVVLVAALVVVFVFLVLELLFIVFPLSAPQQISNFHKNSLTT